MGISMPCHSTAARSQGSRKAEIRIGTAGWAIPTRHQHSVSGNGSHLERYSQRFCAVEINSSFHRHHRLQTYERWASAVPRGFRFSVKLPRALTHSGALVASSEELDRFVEEVRGLGDKLRVLLVQFPPGLAFDRSAASAFFRAIRDRIDVQVACEPRHPSWGSKTADRMLTDCAVARVAADPSPWVGADEPAGSKAFAYIRWHGSPRKYYSGYGEERLETLRQQVVLAGEWASETWVIFDNTVLGCALENALTLTESLASESSASHQHPTAAPES
jgi:uncharacterized protein YecE (DUF72 family)